MLFATTRVLSCRASFTQPLQAALRSRYYTSRKALLTASLKNMMLPYQDEVIDDSEPEREETRRRERDAQKKIKSRRAAKYPVSQEIIEITDDETSSGTVILLELYPF
jgi:hypothetical protein